MRKLFTKNFSLNSIGIILIVFGISRILQLALFGEPIHIFWFCNHILVFMGIAILCRSSFWLIGEFALLFFGQFFWIISFLLYWVFGIVMPGSSAHLIYNSAFINLISILVHFLTLPLGFIAILLLKKKSKFAWKGSLVHFILLLPFILYFGAFYNLNCVLKPCFAMIPDFSLYPFAIILTYLFITIIPTVYLCNYFIKKLKK